LDNEYDYVHLTLISKKYKKQKQEERQAFKKNFERLSEDTV
jgi:hypothetical protein